MNFMENNEKLLKALENLDFSKLVDNEPIFPAETYEIFKQGGLSEKEISTLEYAELRARALEVLPDDKAGAERVLGALAAISRGNREENMKNVMLIAQKDPEMILKLIALTEVVKTNFDEIDEDSDD